MTDIWFCGPAVKPLTLVLQTMVPALAKQPFPYTKHVENTVAYLLLQARAQDSTVTLP